ncbi:MAG: hypothetical protein M3542_12495 [Acidobacteriota bacterium]|nr:hypothetical protein [Acidobacteriota bacterium]MDQ5870655.1 hypothetical protein [Acidobacteriota bacterium]
MRISIAVLVLGILATAACQTERAAVPIVAVPEQRSALVGEWHGEYGSPSTKRSGSIVFFLVEGEDHAHGDVLMIPAGSSEPYRPLAGAAEAAGLRRGPQVLTIRFVRAKEGQISGSLDPYWDPDCDCEVQTSFVGEIQGDRIAGIFTAISGRPGVGRSTGWWEVRRTKPRSSRLPE